MNKAPFVSKNQLENIVSQYSTPFYLYDEATIRANARALNAAFAWNSGFKEYFAVKATPNPSILHILHEEGCGCDCATSAELILAQAAGVSGSEIMLSSNDTPNEDYRLAARLGAIINLDSLDMVGCLKRALDGHLPELVCLRVNPGGTFEAANGIIGTPEDSKFGMTVPQVFEAVRELRNLGVKEFGLHAFLASNTQGNDYYPKLASILFELAVRVAHECDVHIRLIDLSGGVGVAYHPDDVPADIAVIGASVCEAYDKILVPNSMDDIAICTELGRWLMAPAGALITRVIHDKTTYRNYLGVDACAADLMRPAFYDAYHHISVIGCENEVPSRVYSIVGGLCENNDQFARDRIMPPVQIGDFLFIHDCGAHGHSMGYNYNGKLRSAEILLHENGSTSLIRRAETMSDYFSTLDINNIYERLISYDGICKS